jgi:hypothetical protein
MAMRWPQSPSAATGSIRRCGSSLYPDEGPPRWSGVNMWRGVVPHAPFLSGATMVRAGWLSVGKMVIYPIRNAIDDAGRQLVNWVAELECAEPVRRDWSARGRLDDFFPAFADWHFDWLDVAELIRSTDNVLAYPMVDQDPLPRWSFGRVTLLGDAAHPMVPRGSNGAGQAILDASLPRRPARRTRRRRRCARRVRPHPQRGDGQDRARPTAARRPTRSCARCTSGPATSRSRASRTSSRARRSRRSPMPTSRSPA